MSYMWILEGFAAVEEAEEPEEEEQVSSVIVAVGVSASLLVATYAIFILGHNSALVVAYGVLMALAGGWLRGKGKEFKEAIGRITRSGAQ